MKSYKTIQDALKDSINFSYAKLFKFERKWWILKLQ